MFELGDYLKRKAVSTYISVLLLIVVVIAGGILIYGYVMGWFGRLGGEGELGTLSVDSSKAYATNNTVLVWVRNIGKSSVSLEKVYVDDIPQTMATTTIGVNQVVRVNITGASLTAGATYEVKLVGKDNTQIAFSVKAE